VAIKVARSKHARRVIVAVPVMPSDRVYHFRDLCDELVFLMAPSQFMCVSQYYGHFPQLSHGDVIDLLEEARLRKLKERQT
jgi:predicted phosphoribosyltransferase